MMLWQWGLLAAGILLLAGIIDILVLDWIWRAREKRNPFTYRDVPFAELREHFNELLRRGFCGAEMVAVDNSSGKSIRVRKYYDRAISIHVIADQIGRDDPRAEDMLSRVARVAPICRWGLQEPVLNGIFGRRLLYKDTLTCQCRFDLDRTMQVAEIVLFEFYELPRSSTFTVFLIGGISVFDKLVGVRYRIRDSFSPLNQIGKPYRRWHIEASKRWLKRPRWAVGLGMGVGGLIRAVRSFLFSRGPHEDR